MAQEVLCKVNEAEERCADMIRAAHENEKAILDKAKTDAYEQYKATVLQSKKRRKEQLEAARAEAQRECDAIAAKGAADMEKIKTLSDDQFDTVVRAVMERVVNMNGHR